MGDYENDLEVVRQEFQNLQKYVFSLKENEKLKQQLRELATLSTNKDDEILKITKELQAFKEKSPN